jgi:hypothetical protein
MRRSALVFVAWGLWLGAWTSVQLVFAHSVFGERTIQWVMLGGASAGAIAVGVAVWQLGRARDTRPPRARLITDESAATATFAVGVALALLGASFGLFLLLIGCAIAALGLGGLLREGIARRRCARRGRIE